MPKKEKIKEREKKPNENLPSSEEGRSRGLVEGLVQERGGGGGCLDLLDGDDEKRTLN